MTAAACSRGMPLTAVAVTDRAVVAAIRIAYERRFVLVRPDGHVAWRGDHLPDDPGAVLEIVRGRRQSAHQGSLAATEPAVARDPICG